MIEVSGQIFLTLLMIAGFLMLFGGLYVSDRTDDKTVQWIHIIIGNSIILTALSGMTTILLLIWS